MNKKQTDSEFIKSLPSHSGKEFEIQKRLDRLQGIKRFDNKNKKNNNNDDGDGGAGGGFFGLGPTTIKTKIYLLFLGFSILTKYSICCLKSMMFSRG